MMLKQEIQELEKRYRANLVNSLSGFKSANLIGTVNNEGLENLAVFSSVVHIGANPALMGFIMRPISVPRHTYQNIVSTKYFTINHIHPSFCDKAHQTAARYEDNISEFTATGLSPYYTDNIPAPYVKESRLKIGLSLADIIPITINNTCMVVGAIEEVVIDTKYISSDGYVDIEKLESLAVSGLDTYHQTSKLARFAYPKPHKLLEKIQ